MSGATNPKKMKWIASVSVAAIAALAVGGYFLAGQPTFEAMTGGATSAKNPSAGGSSLEGTTSLGGGAAANGGSEADSNASPYTIVPKTGSHDATLTAAPEASEADGVENANEVGTKAPRKKFSELTTEEKRRYVEGRARRANFRRSRIATAKSAARDERACGSGDTKACARLKDKSATGDRVAVLTEVKSELSGACNGKDLNACIHRGDLDLVGTDKTTAAAWYDKAKKIAGEIKATCDSGEETNKRKCARARRSYDQITKREQRLAANDAGGAGGPLKANGGKIKQPRTPRPPMSQIFKKGKLAPKTTPLAPMEQSAPQPVQAEGESDGE